MIPFSIHKVDIFKAQATVKRKYNVRRWLLGLLLLTFTITARAQLSGGWPKILGGPQNTSYTTAAGTIPVVKWTFQIPDNQSPPSILPVIGGDGTVYVGYGRSLYAIDGATGKSKWTYTPASSYGRCGYLAVSSNGAIYAQYESLLVALDASSGAQKWTFGDGSNGAPTIGPDDTVYADSSTGFSALDPKTGTPKWTIPASISLSTTAAIGSDGTIYFSGNGTSGSDGSPGMFAVNPVTGSYLFSSNGPTGHGYSSPIVGLAGSLYASYQGYLYSFTTGLGGASWKDTVYGLGGIVVAPSGLLYVTGGLSGDPPQLSVIDGQTGNVLSSVTIPEILNSTIMGGDGTIYGIGSDFTTGHLDQSTLYAINSQSGAAIWSIPNMGPVADTCIALGPDGTLVFAQGQNIVALKSINVINISLNPTSVQGGTSSTGTVTLNAPAPTGGWVATLTSNNPNAQVPTSVTVPAGQSSATFTVTTSVVATQAIANVSAMPGQFQVAQLTITPPPLTGVTVSPTSLSGGTNATGTVTIAGVAPSGGLVVLLSSGNTAAKVPASVKITEGASTATFPITTSGVDASTPVVISATLNSQIQTATLTIIPGALNALKLSPTSVLGGGTSTGTVTLDGPAGPSGRVVSLTSADASATVPGSVTISPGNTSATFTVSTKGVNSQISVLITGTLNSISQAATLTIQPTALVSISVNPATVLGGGVSTGTVSLSGPAATGGTVISLASSNAAATAPSSVTVSAGQKTATFSISTTGVNTSTAVTLTATLNSQSQTAILTITPATLTGISLSPTTVLGGNSSVGTLNLSGPAAAGGTIVRLQSQSPEATLPATVTVPAGANTATFNISTLGVNAQTPVTITATLNETSKSAVLTISPATLTGLTLNPSTVSGGNSVTGTVTLSGPAAIGSTVISLSSSNPSATVATSVTVPAGQKSATFNIATVPVTSLTYSTIAASLNGTTQSTSLAITATTLIGLTLNPSTLAGNASSTGTVTLSGPAPSGGIAVSLASSTLSAVVPFSLMIPAGHSSGNFTLNASAVTSQVVATITATAGTLNRTASLTLVPIALASITLSPSSVTGGITATGTVSLNGLAPKGGLVVKLSSGSPSVIVPASVTIPAGASSANFNASTKAVPAKTDATVSAKLASVTQTTTLEIQPPVLTSIVVSPATVVGGNSTTGTVTLTGPAPTGGEIVKLSSNSASATLPTMVTVPAGKSTARFTVKTIPVATTTNATLTASLAGVTQTASVKVSPPSLISVALSPTSVAGGKTSTATVKLSSPAPASGLTITLSSSLAAATVPSTLTIAAGKTSATFTVKTSKVTLKSIATISAGFAGALVTANLTITSGT